MTSSSDTIRARIVQKRLEAEDIVSLRLRGIDSTLPAFEPGAHIDLHLPGGLIRQYSLCGHDPLTNEYEIAVLREPASRGGSAAVHDIIQVSQEAIISAPRNHFPLDSTSGGRILLFAGGIGVTPIMAMAETLGATGRAFELHYCGRTASRMAYLTRIAAGLPAGSALIHTDDGAESQKLDLARAIGRCSTQDRLYVCGPAGFIEAVLSTARDHGWPEEQLHREFFAAPDQEAAFGENRPFTVEIGSSGLKFLVPADRTIAEVLSENGVFIPTSCAEGICGTCVVNVLEGEIDHRDFLFSDTEKAVNSKLTTCCSRAKSDRLVLDL